MELLLDEQLGAVCLNVGHLLPLETLEKRLVLANVSYPFEWLDLTSFKCILVTHNGGRLLREGMLSNGLRYNFLTTVLEM